MSLRLAIVDLVVVALVVALPAQTHWSLVPPQLPPVPAVRNQAWPRNDLDRFVLAELEARGMHPSPPVDPETWLRRVTLDLIGLPPTLEELDAFLVDPSADARARVVDRLLASPHYGERWARPWLDLARYADTNGYEKDRPRSIWPWRDWVIRALNDDLPFDKFTIWQLAGDMLPQPTRDQIVATGFHRNSMLNQEGGIDVEQFRYAAIVDRVNTTATTWLGLTVGCAQCHDHKYDPISQREYFGLLAIFDNCDEVELALDDDATAAAKRQALAELDARRRGLAEQFPLPVPDEFSPLPPTRAVSLQGAELSIAADASVTARGDAPARDTYEVETTLPAGYFVGVRVEALVDADDASRGPGRTEHGNFVLSELEVSITDPTTGDGWRRLTLDAAEADFSQSGYPVAAAIDGDPDTGWGIHAPGSDWRRDHAARFVLAEPQALAQPTRAKFVLQQRWGSQHTLHRFRLGVALGVDQGDGSARRRELLEARFAAWLATQRASARAWRVIIPDHMHSAGAADLAVREDGSVFVYGNNPDHDTTTLTLTPSGPVAALRVEALPEPTLPDGGPGRSPFFPTGGFMLSDARARVVAPDGGTVRDLRFATASASYEHGEHPAIHAIDDAADTGWTNEGHVGHAQHIVLGLAAPLRLEPGQTLELTLAQHSIHNNNLGRFRLSFSARAPAARACSEPAAVEALLARGPAIGPDELAVLRQAFVESAPELARAHAELDALRRDLPRPPTTLVLHEREPARARQTHRRQRGEFTRPREVVSPGVPACLPPLPAGMPPDRLALARWLVSGSHPLTARVVVNRAFAAFFGRGLVPTVQDFGTRGETPSHPALLDWLACRFVSDGWSMKRLHRSIVTSATYAQSAAVVPDLRERDPDNRWLARMQRLRLPAELLRDQALAVTGLLSTRMFGKSVFPPQPKGVADVAYGQFEWKVSQGEDRYRRGLYTYAKRTAPYAMHALFDAPSGEACVALRGRSDTPLQALTLLNDEVFVEAARALGSEVCRSAGDDRARLRVAFRRCVARLPTDIEEATLLAFLARQRERVLGGDLDARALAGRDSSTEDDEGVDAAAWTALARVLLNLDEMVVRG
ncbi:MAG: DUF1549 and DUF1553 domain-containing protein [Planctomycetota bacterium]